MSWTGKQQGLSGFDLGRGAVPGAFQFNTFGFADDIDTVDPPVDIWNGFQIDGLSAFTFSSTDDINTISSSNGGDTQTILVIGLDANRKYTTVMTTLNGQTKVTLGTALIRVNRVINLSPTDIAGVVRVYVDTPIIGGVPTDKTTIRGYINGADNISQQALFSTPSDFDTVLLNTFANVGKAASGAGAILADVETRFVALGGAQILSGHFTANTEGTGAIGFESPVPVQLQRSADLFWKVTDVSANGTRLNCGFNFELYPR